LFNKAKKLIVSVAALTAMSVSVANATPFTWTDSVNPSDFVISGNQSYSFIHDITDGSHGYQPGVDSITSASLTIWLYDDALFGDSVWGDSKEHVNFTFDLFDAGTSEVGGNFIFEDAFNFSVPSLLSGDGKLNVTLQGKGGDFVVDRSELVVRGNKSGKTAQVPEPASLALFGLGLLGVGVAGKRRGAKAV
jgi:hypothetical protein